MKANALQRAVTPWEGGAWLGSGAGRGGEPRWARAGSSPKKARSSQLRSLCSVGWPHTQPSAHSPTSRLDTGNDREAPG